MNPKLVETIGKYLLLPLIKEVGGFILSWASKKWKEYKIKKAQKKKLKQDITNAEIYRDSDETNSSSDFNNLP